MKALRVTAILVAALFCVSLFSGLVMAEEKIKVQGTIKDYDIGKKVVLINTADGKEMSFVVENESALKKLDDRLFRDDEVKIKYVIMDGKNVIKGSNDLKGTKPGC